MKCKEALKKQIDILRDQQNYLWTAVFITGGGAFTIALNNLHSVLALSLAVLGLIFSGLFLKHFFKGQQILTNYIIKLKEMEENP